MEVLWDKFSDDLSDDFLRWACTTNQPNPVVIAKKSALHAIHTILQENNMTLAAFISVQQDMMNYATNNLGAFPMEAQDLDSTTTATYTPASLNQDQYSIFFAVR